MDVNADARARKTRVVALVAGTLAMLGLVAYSVSSLSGAGVDGAEGLAVQGTSNAAEASPDDFLNSVKRMRRLTENRGIPDPAPGFSGGALARVLEQTFPTSSDQAGTDDGRRRVEMPTHGEGAPETNWDELSPDERVELAQGHIEQALARVAEAKSPTEAEEWRSRATTELSAVRMDIVQHAGGIERYAELEALIDGQ